jgi:hypothetical protein
MMTGGAVVLAVGLGTGLVAFYNGNLSIGPGGRASADLAYLPQDAAAVAYADVRAIMDSQFRHRLKQVLPTGEALAAFKAELGVDIEKDIDTVSAAFFGGGEPALENIVVVVRGRFDEKRIQSHATQYGGVVQEYAGTRVLAINEGRRDEMGPGHHASAAVAFLSPNALALGELAAVKRAIDAGPSGSALERNAEMMALINELHGEGTAWFVARVDALAGRQELPSEIREHIPAINLFAATLTVNGGVSGTLRAEARDAEAAENLREAVRGGLAIGRLISDESPQVQAMLKSLQIIGRGKTVGVAFRMPIELLDLVKNMAAEGMRR